MEAAPKKRRLDVASADKSLWLVKIPQAVADKWAEAGNNEILGTLTITSTPAQSGKPSSHKLSVKLVEDDSSESTTAGEYTIDELPTGPQIYAFEHDKTGNSFSIKGRVSKKYNLRPRLNSEYHKNLRMKTLKASQTHQISSVDSAEAMIKNQGRSGEVDFIPPIHADARKRDTDSTGRRTKGTTGADTGDVRQRMLNAFAQNEHLTLKELNSICRSNEKELRKLLDQYAIYHSKGKLKTHWQLKEEYRSR